MKLYTLCKHCKKTHEIPSKQVDSRWELAKLKGTSLQCTCEKCDRPFETDVDHIWAQHDHTCFWATLIALASVVTCCLTFSWSTHWGFIINLLPLLLIPIVWHWETIKIHYFNLYFLRKNTRQITTTS